VPCQRIGLPEVGGFSFHGATALMAACPVWVRRGVRDHRDRLLRRARSPWLKSWGLSSLDRNHRRAQQTVIAEREVRIRSTRQQVKERSATVALGALDKLYEQMEAGKELDYGKIAKEAMVAHGIASDKDALDDGRPTQIVEQRKPEEALRLRAKYAITRRYDVEGDAEDD
jgi:hypothetical protein